MKKTYAKGKVASTIKHRPLYICNFLHKKQIFLYNFGFYHVF